MIVVATAIQIIGGIAVAPLLPGVTQTIKARLQGRRGPSPMQPYRELRKLWGKGPCRSAAPTIVYRLAPCVVAAATALALLLVPIAGIAPDWSLGNDALVLVGLLALARFALAASSWDTGSGFALMGSSRDLTVSVFVEALLVLAIVLAALPAGSTDFVSMVAAASGPGAWSEPAHWCAAAAFGLVVLAETGRQPIDNPDTHLELTMIHEGPLLEYAGRDLALLEWSVAARHWIVLVLGAQLFLPHWGRIWHPARMPHRRYRLPLRGAGAGRDRPAEDADPARAGPSRGGLPPRARWTGQLATGRGRMSSAMLVALVALGVGVILARRRSLATLLVAIQALLLGVAALSLEGDSDGALLVAGGILMVRAVALPALLTLARLRTPEPRLIVPATTVGVRLLVSTAVALVAMAVIPPLGLGDRAVEHTAVALLSLGIATVIMRRPALLQVLGIVVAENGVYLLAIAVPGGLPFVIELGVLFDLALVVTVAAAFTQKIQDELGTGDTDLLRGLRD